MLARLLVLVFLVLGCAGKHPTNSQVSSDAPPQSPRAAQVFLRQAEGARNSAYHLRREAGTLVARNPDQGIVARFENGRAAFAADSGAAVALHATEIRCGNARIPLGDGQQDSRLAAHRVDSSQQLAAGGSFAEWWVNGPLGLEHGFTLQKNPCSSNVLELRVAVEGASASGRGEVKLQDRHSQLGFVYRDAFAVDAQGRDRAVELEAVSETTIALRVQTAGATWPLRIDPLLVTQQGKLVDPRAAGAAYGASIAVSGTTLIVGSPDGLGGSAFVLTQIGTNTQFWFQQRLVASDQAANDQFGRAVDVDGDYAAVGANGAVYVFVRSAGVWQQQQKIAINGQRVALSGAALVIGSGSNVYVYARSGTNWSQQQQLTPSDSPTGYGSSIAIEGNTVVVGAETDAVWQGSAYVFVRAAATWSQ